MHRQGRDLFSGVSLTLRRGEKLGLIGRNGVGKSTLLGLLARRLEPAEGRVIRAPGLRLGYLQQEGAFLGKRTVWETSLTALGYVRSLEDALREEEARISAGEERLLPYGDLRELFEGAGGYQAEARLKEMLSALGFAADSYDLSVASLSGGERARLALALVLAEQPEMLLLDEPSNGLDIDMRRWLAEILCAYSGGLILASHDRALLEAVSTHTLHLQGSKLTTFKGNYASFHRQQGTVNRTLQRQQKERHKAQSRLGASSQRLANWGTPTAQRQRKALEKKLERLPAIPTESTVPTQERALELRTETQRGTLLQAQHLSKTFKKRVIVKDVSLSIEAGDKIALVGPNGMGKSTLLELITGELESDHPEISFTWSRDARVAIFDQQQRGLQADVSLLSQLTSYVSEPRARLLLALVGIPAGQWLHSPAALSGGEKARVGIALIIASEANLLVLDEPSEGLAIGMIEKLEHALQDTKAAFILVSHDQKLVEHVAERVWTLEDGELKEFRGGLEGYYRGDLRLSIDPNDLQKEEEKRKKEETAEGRLERLELEGLELTRRLLDPFLLSERERERLELRQLELWDELSELYDLRLPPPLPRYTLQHGAITVSADQQEAGYDFSSNSGLSARLLTPGQEHIGHLVLDEPENGCLLPWALELTLATMARLSFEHLNVEVLQTFSQRDLSASGFRQAGGHWWTWTRHDYERLEGYILPKARTGKRRQQLYFHPDWKNWSAFRRWRKRRSRP